MEKVNDEFPTTAQALGAFLRELRDQGFDYEDAVSLVDVFARDVSTREKLIVSIYSVVAA